jgi:acyl-CoA synthetase (AMP-forming)/AMP-acid ligase II
MEWNAADLLEAVADTVPHAEALVVDGGPRLTWAEFDSRATRLANYLLGIGLEPGAHVACYMANGNEYLETMLACFKARMVPINVNWRYTPSELVYLFNDADVQACVIDEEFVPVLDEARPQCEDLAHILRTGPSYEDALSSSSVERPFEGERSADDLYILYTGGTTGMPKGVVWRQEDIIGAVWRVTAGLDMQRPPDQIGELARNPRTKYLAIPPFMHGAAHWGAFGVFLGGGCVLCRRGTSLDAAATLRFIAEEKPNMGLIVGDAFAAPLIEALDEAKAAGRPYDVSSLRVLVSSGAPLSLHYKKRLQENIPNLIIVDTLGSSESGLEAVNTSRPGAGGASFVPNEATIVLDEDTLQPLVPGSNRPGVVAKTGFLPLGYYKDDEKTARTFPTVNGTRYVLTGDHALLRDDGSIVLLGRGNACINTGGEKVYPEEVEDALKQHPAIRDALVVGVPDKRFGSAVAAVVELRDSSNNVTVETLREFLAGLLAGYKLPRHVVVAERIRRAPSGKPDYEWARTFATEKLEIKDRASAT